MNICVIFYNLGGYHLSRLNAADKSFQRRGWRLTCIEITRSTSEHPWGKFELPDYVTTLEDFQPGDQPSVSDPATVSAALDQLNPDVVVVPGWGHNFARTALQWSRRHRKPAILMCESKKDDAPRNVVKELWKKHRYVRNFDAAIVGGRKHAEYLVELGMPRDRVFFGYDVVDTTHLAKEVDRIRSSSEPRPNGIPKSNFIVSVNRFIDRKNLGTLIDAFADSAKTNGHNWDLVLVGGGETEADLRLKAEQTGLGDRIHFPGFLSYSDVPMWYAHAGIFVHPARAEQWGLVVNEAMAAELPIILSNACGCYPDLIEEGQSGLSFSPNAPSELSEKLTALIEAPDLRRSMAIRSRQIISERYSPDAFGEGLSAAVETAKQLRVQNQNS